MNNSITFLVNKAEDGSRLDKFLAAKINDLTRSNLKKIIEIGNVKIDNKIIISPSKKIKKNQTISINVKKKINNKLIPSKVNLDIRFEDKDILVINKPKGMVVHPGAGNYNNTLANALVNKFKNKLSDLGGKMRPGIVHRIDKDTSGLLVIAKNNLAHAKLGEQFSQHSIHRKYKCLIWGILRPLEGKIETLIVRDKKNRQLMTTSEIKGKKAITNYKTIKVYTIKDIPKISLIECELETGRTHQIRVHLRYKKSSILGDLKYGKKNPKFKKINKDFLQILKNINGQVLHAQTLSFKHPSSNKKISFKADIPEDFKKMLNFLNNLAS